MSIDEQFNDDVMEEITVPIGDMPRRMCECIVWLQALLERVPVEFRDGAIIDFNHTFEQVGVTYFRPRNEEELRNRLLYYSNMKNEAELELDALLKQKAI